MITFIQVDVALWSPVFETSPDPADLGLVSAVQLKLVLLPLGWIFGQYQTLHQELLSPYFVKFIKSNA